MTALKKFARLECAGLWRETTGSQRREVVVSLGDASLILTDGRNETALSHWSLPAVMRLNAGTLPALYAPTPEADGETLEIDDTTMIDAIETVRGVIAAKRPIRGRLRIGIFASIMAAGLGLAVFWLPGAVVSHTAEVIPTATRSAIGRAARADLARLTGVPCVTPLGQRALSRLSTRLFGSDGTEIAVVRQGVTGALELPGKFMLLDRTLLETYDTPEVAAGHLVVARLRAGAVDPMLPLLRHAGLGATFRLLTTGDLPAGALAGYGERALTSTSAVIDSARVLAAFAAAQFAPSPYVRSLPRNAGDMSETVAIDANLAGAMTSRALLADADWVSLQAICSP